MSPRFVSASLAALLLSLLPASLSAQTDVDALWTRYEEAATRFDALMTEVEGEDPMATGGNRVYRQAIEAGTELAAVIESLLSTDANISPDDRDAAVDGLLTTRQVVGSLMVEIGDCDEARVVLQTVLQHPLIESRQIVRDSAQTWTDRANTCVEDQQRAEEERIRAEQERLAQEQSGGGGDAVPGEGPEREEEGGVNLPAWILIGVGGGALLGGMGWDLSLGGTRSDFAELNDQCGSTGCSDEEVAERDSLKEKIDGAKIPIAALTFGGIAIAGAGTAWLLLGGGSGEDDGGASSSLAPWVDGRTLGFVVSGHF